MRFVGMCLAILAAAAVSTGALAATAAKNPNTLILRQADFGARAQYDSTAGDDGLGIEDELAAKGLNVEAASYLGATYSRARGFLQVSGAVWAPTGVADAKKVYAAAKRHLDTQWRRLGGAPRITVRPSYGNQQTARYDAAGGEGIAIVEMLVRRNSVVWLLTVKAERRPNIPKRAEALAQLRKFAAKQQRRVGAG